MKKMRTIGKSVAALGLTAVLLTGCFANSEKPQETSGPASTAAAPQESVQPTSEPLPTEAPTPMPGPKIEISETLDTMSGWGAGTAGSSLASASSAYELLLWSDTNQAQTLDTAALQQAITDWLNAQVEELQPDLVDNWHTVSSVATDILNEEEFAMGILSDFGKEPIESETIKDNWAAFCKAADAAFGQNV